MVYFKNKQKLINLKQLPLTPTIQQHHFQTNFKNPRNFLSKPHKSKLSIPFTRPPITHKQIRHPLLQKFPHQSKHIPTLQQNPKIQPPQIFIILPPINQK
ncbi:translation initiation factor IF-3 [Staphylococcus epidermidis]|uniref:hypothetical protein n=1 Tax=Staphylococcus epidermidis TaxID=1282 RepID=UPI0011AA1C56